MHWDHEPLAVPRRTKSADKSDALQTLRAVRGRPAVAKRLECVRLQRRFSKAGCDSMPRQIHGDPPSAFAHATGPCARGRAHSAKHILWLWRKSLTRQYRV